LHEKLAEYDVYNGQLLTKVRPLFISWAATRRNSGAAHKETVYARPSEKHILEGVADPSDAIQRIEVKKLKITDLERIVGVHDKRNAPMIASLRKWIQASSEREKRAKAIEASAGKGKERRALTESESSELKSLRDDLPRKPLADGSPGQIIRAVKINIGRTSGTPVRGGIAANDSMVRIDIFAKDGKFFIVPIYVSHMVKSELPNLAIVQNKNENEWTLIDDAFDFKFACYPNDLLRITLKEDVRFGYYSQCDRSTGCVSLWTHDRDKSIGTAGLIRGIGIKTAINVEKFNVDVLGRIYPALIERRRELA
jgi:CRISPR-associated endonuclease Csn1